jgi:hypothetical protein
MSLFIPRVPPHLTESVRNKSAVLVVGAGVSIAATNNASTASWKGLLRHGVQHCQDFGKPPLQSEMVDNFCTILDSNDTDSWLSVATLIERKLKYPDNREWAKWLSETVGALRTRNCNILEALLSLNIPIVTTNYDSLFEDATLTRSLQPLTWTTPYFDHLFFAHPEKYIFHLHGHHGFPDSVVLGLASYTKIVGHDFTQMFTKLLSLRQGLIFVGYGAGFDDPNFSQLLTFVEQQGSSHRHYILVRDSELVNYDKYNNIYAVAYGTDHTDLPIFLRTLPFGRERYVYARPTGYAELLMPGVAFQDLPYCPKMVPLSAGSYERPRGTLRINITEPFAISESVVTIDEWDIFSSETGYHARKFIGYTAWLSQVTGRKYRLPTEAEWEYAAAGACSDAYWWGSAAAVAYANYRESKLATTSPVRSYPPNPYGVYDMNGNVWEWCIDNFALDESNIPPDGSAFVTSENTTAFRSDERILKGGCFYYDASFMTTFSRIHLEEDAVFNSTGVRVVREIGELLVSGRPYFITCLFSPLAITAISSDEIGLRHFSMEEDQLWLALPGSSGAGSFLFENVKTKQRLGYDHGGPDYLSLCKPTAFTDCREEWVVRVALGGYMLFAGPSTKVLDAEGGRSRKMPDLILFEQHGNFNQIWNFLPKK